MSNSPKFIVLEGGEGAGKTTQIRYLAKSLDAAGIANRFEREPGGTELGETLRRMLKGYNHPDYNEWDALCGFSVARKAFILEVVQPTLASGRWLLSDRFAFSTLVYQGHAAGLPYNVVKAVVEGVVGNNWPDLTIYLDLPAEVGLARRAAEADGEGTRYEDKGLEFHRAVHKGYQNVAPEYMTTTAVVNADQSEAQVHHAILAEVNYAFRLNLQPVI